jgi:hypothetical protein
MFAALDQPGLRLEVAVPFGFNQDPKATSERIGQHPPRPRQRIPLRGYPGDDQRLADAAAQLALLLQP